MIKTYTAKSLNEFLQHIPSQVYTYDRWIYRGVESAEQKLIPGLFRNAKHTVDGRYWNEVEAVMLTKFSNGALPYTQWTPPTLLDQLALAQHHGLPTRLLDWTFNPLVALFFAVSNDEWTLRFGDEPDSLVWFMLQKCYDTPQIEKLDQISTMCVHVPTHVSPRIAAQRGCFTVHPLPGGKGSFTPLEEVGDLWLHKVIIPNAQRPKIKAELDAIGINYASLFPDLDGLARQIKWEDTEEKRFHQPADRDGRLPHIAPSHVTDKT